jgi:gag-polyprotein putative aspartyl protease
MLVKFPIHAVLYLYTALFLSAPAFAACSLTKVTEMPLFKLGSHYAVSVRIDDEVRSMMVDTGAAITTITLSVANELEMKRDSSLANARSTIGIGQTKAETYLSAIPSVLVFGDLVYHDRSTAVSRMDFGNSPERETLGLLGDDILSQFDVEFDFPGGKLTFYHASGCYDSFIPWTGNYSATPFVHENTKVMMDIVLNDEREQAIVDTGNNVSFVSQSLLSRWRIDDSQLLKTKITVGSPLNGGTYNVLKLFAFNEVKIGYDTFPATTMGIVDVNLPLGMVNLGVDFWKSRKVWISYPNKWIFISTGPTALAYPVTASKPEAAEAE